MLFSNKLPFSVLLLPNLIVQMESGMCESITCSRNSCVAKPVLVQANWIKITSLRVWRFQKESTIQH
jgi:hypothetical protein